jgi:hypothetical protein
MVDPAGRIWHTVQGSANDNNGWGPFLELDSLSMFSIAAARNSDGRLVLVGVDSGGNPQWRAEETAGSDSWVQPWTPLPTKTLAHLTVATNPIDGRIQIDGVDFLGNVWQSEQQQPGSASFVPWTHVDGQVRP